MYTPDTDMKLESRGLKFVSKIYINVTFSESCDLIFFVHRNKIVSKNIGEIASTTMHYKNITQTCASFISYESIYYYARKQNLDSIEHKSNTQLCKVTESWGIRMECSLQGGS